MLFRKLFARWSVFRNAPRRRRQPTQARAAGDEYAKCRRREEAPTARRWRLDITTLMLRHCRAGSSASLHWRLGVVALAHKHGRTGASALATLSRWRIGVVALVHAGALLLYFFNGGVLWRALGRRHRGFLRIKTPRRPTRAYSGKPVVYLFCEGTTLRTRSRLRYSGASYATTLRAVKKF
jgi:hypothetical protein